jgi:glycerol 3-phosphatase-2
MSPLRGTEVALASAYDGTLLDLDGTVHRSGTVIPGVLDAIEASTRDHGMRHMFVTNNASRTPEELVDDLRALGIDTDPKHVFTSAQAAARLAAARLAPGAAVLVVGGSGVRSAVEDVGLRVVDGDTASTEAPVAVVQGWFPDLGWRLLAEGAFAVAGGALWVATNLDLTLPTSRGVAPGNGSFVRAVAAAAGREPDLVAGKPQPAILVEAAAAGALGHPLVVGDRLDTDIEGANAASMDSLLVLTGVTDALRLLRAPDRQRPTYVGAGLEALLRPAPEPRPVDGGADCGEARVRRAADGELELASVGDPLDVLRAACTAAWAAEAPPEVRLSSELRAALAGFVGT